jgi:AraC-like DNA-binding protein
MNLGDLSVRYLQRLLMTLASLRGDTHALTDRYGLNRHFLNDPEARISISKFMRIGFDIIQQTQRPDIGLLAGHSSTISDLGLTGHLSMVAPDLATAIQTWCHYERLSSQNCRGHSQFIQEGNKCRLQFYSISPYNAYNEFVVDMVLSSWWEWLKWLSSKPLQLTEVHLEYAEPRYHEALTALFECPVRFNQESNALILASELAKTPSAYAHPLMYKTLAPICDLQMERQSKTRSYTERVQEALGPMLEGSNPTLESVAQEINIPTWTLRRKLLQESSRFQDILDNTRQSLAKSYIRDTDFTLGEISYLLGFSSPTAFQRAFKRWTNVAPGEYRRVFKDQDAACLG